MNITEIKDFNAFIALKENLRRQNETIYKDMNIFIDDFSYGNPQIMMFGDDVTKLRIGKFCSLAAGCMIVLGGEHRPDWNTTYPFNKLLPSFSYITGHPKTKGDIVIGNDVWIGGHSKILSGVTIGDGCVVGANSLVTKDMSPYTIWGGVPAKLIKPRFSEEYIERFMEMKWWNWGEDNIFSVIPLLQSNKLDELYAYYKTKVSPARKTQST